MKVIQMRTNHIEKPAGYDYSPLSLSWKVTECGNAKKQKYAQVIVKQEGNIVFDSGMDMSADSLDYQVNMELKPRTLYDWTVTVTADNGQQAQGQSTFETGKMNEPWQGQWITPNQALVDENAGNGYKNAGYILQKSFEICDPDSGFTKEGIAGKKQKSRLYICGLGVYECYINGHKVGDEYLAPGYHSYDFHLQTAVFDVTDYLKNGENKIEIWLGDGWFKSRMGFDGGIADLYGDKLHAICELYVGEKLVVKTDKDWESKISPIVFSGIYDGEIYDARLKNSNRTGSVQEEIPAKCGELTDRYSLPIVKKEKFEPKEVIVSPKGETILDFGQNLTGWTEFDCHLPKGTQIRLTACEILQDGCFYHDNLRLAKTEYVYISDGEPAHVRPHFTFYGFRYMLAEIKDTEGQWEALPKDCAAYHFTACHLRSDFDQIGSIVTGHKKVNQLFSNALWGQKDNFLDVPTDCPQRDERLGWTGDAQVFSETACYNMYMPAFYRKYLWDMRAEQSITGGAVPNVVPRIKEGMVSECGNCPWADAGVIIPWNVYLHYGSKSLLKETYPGMKAWVDYERRKEESEGGPHLVKSGFHFADWLALDNDVPGPFGATDPLYIASAYYYRCTKIVGEAAKILGYEDDARQYEHLSREILTAVREKYFDENGLCVCKTQTGAALAIMFGLISDDKYSLEGGALNERIEANNHHLNTGFVGTTMLCPALTRSGHHETAVDLLLNESFPGWLYCVNLGATTIWERWDSVLPDGHMNPEGMNSLNHYSYGSIEAWMYGDVCGIRPLTPGFKKAVIAPHVDERLGYADCTLDTAAGQYRCSWKYENKESVCFEIEVPFNAEAMFTFNGCQKRLLCGKYIFSEKTA